MTLVSWRTLFLMAKNTKHVPFSSRENHKQLRMLFCFRITISSILRFAVEISCMVSVNQALYRHVPHKALSSRTALSFSMKLTTSRNHAKRLPPLKCACWTLPTVSTTLIESVLTLLPTNQSWGCWMQLLNRQPYDVTEITQPELAALKMLLIAMDKEILNLQLESTLYWATMASYHSFYFI